MIQIDSLKLYNFFNKLSTVCKELRLYINNSIWYRTVDTSNCVMQECRIEAEDCLIFNEEDKEVGIYLDRVLPFITAHKKDGYITMDFTLAHCSETERTYKLTLSTSTASITCDCPSVNVIRRTPNSVTINTSDENQFEFNVTVKEMKEYLKTINAKGTSKHSDCITFSLIKDQLTILDRDNGISTTVTARTPNQYEAPIVSNYSYKFLKNYLKTCDSKSVLWIHIMGDHPAEIKEQSNYFNYFLVAPRIES